MLGFGWDWGWQKGAGLMVLADTCGAQQRVAGEQTFGSVTFSVP